MLTAEFSRQEAEKEAEWEPEEVPLDGLSSYLEEYGFPHIHSLYWSAIPKVKFELQTKAHTSCAAGHTWYIIECLLKDESRTIHIEWTAPRRLCMMRKFLHDAVKEQLGELYPEYFSGTPFAHLAGPPGTTDRLCAWLKSLSTCISNGTLPPEMVARVLKFLKAPIPKQDPINNVNTSFKRHTS